MKIAYLTPALFGPTGIRGGAERYAWELARHMASAQPTRLISFGGENRMETIEGLEVRVIGPTHRVRGQAHNPFSWQLFHTLKGADIVHCHQTHILASSLAALYARIKGKRVFTTDLGGGGWDLSSYQSTDRWFHGHLHLSEYSRRVFGHQNLARAQVIGGGVDPERFAPAQTEPRNGRALFVGRLLPHKGVEYLIEAAGSDLPVDIIGSSSEPDYLAELHALADGKDIQFHLDCSEEKLRQAYRTALCLVLPSVYRTKQGRETRIPELLGQTLLEAMSSGTPVIGTAVASLPEIIRDHETGFLVPPNDARAIREKILYFRHRPKDTEGMGQKGRKHVRNNFSWRAVVQRCLAIYRQA